MLVRFTGSKIDGWREEQHKNCSLTPWNACWTGCPHVPTPRKLRFYIKNHPIIYPCFGGFITQYPLGAGTKELERPGQLRWRYFHQNLRISNRKNCRIYLSAAWCNFKSKAQKNLRSLDRTGKVLPIPKVPFSPVHFCDFQSKDIETLALRLALA
jgi:hypothetical protein